MWEKIDEIFPKGGTILDGQFYSNEEIAASGLDTIVSYIQKPVRSMIENQMEYTYYANGDMIAQTVYNIFPPRLIDGFAPLNVYGQKILNDILRNEYE